MHSINKNDWIHRWQGTILPFLDFGKELICDIGYHSFTDFKTINILYGFWNLSCSHPLCIHCNNLVINGRNIFLTFWKYLWFKRTLTILRYIYFEFTVFTTNSFRLCSITVIRLTGSFITIVSKMIIHFCFKHILKGSGKQIFKCLLNIICWLDIVFLEQSLNKISFSFCHRFWFVNFFFSVCHNKRPPMI